MIRLIFAVVVVLAQTAPVAAQTAGPLAAATPTKDVSGVTVTGKKAAPGAQDPNEMVCHKEPVLGTMFPKVVCARREDIADRRRLDQATTREAQAQRPWKDPAQ